MTPRLPAPTRLLGRRSERRHAIARTNAACAYAARGWALLPAARDPEPMTWFSRASVDPVVLRTWWSRNPDNGLLTATGTAFDALVVPASAGRYALLRLERLGVRLGPVLHMPAPPVYGTAFFVAPGSAVRLPEVLRRLRWDAEDVDLRVLGPGDWLRLPDPPGCRTADTAGPSWLREPPPDAEPLLLPTGEQLIGTLLHACRRTRGRRLP